MRRVRPDLSKRNRLRAEEMRKAQLSKYRRTRSGCWLWTGGVGNDGYGKIKRGRKTLRAHRVFYEEYVGKIPKGLLVCHKCDVPLCVNPKHLFVGTHLENEQDKTRKNRRPAKLTAKKVQLARVSPLSNKDIAAKLGVDPSSISRIRSRETWVHVL